MVSGFECDQARVWNTGGYKPTFFEGDGRVSSRMDYERRGLHLREVHGHINRAKLFLKSDRVLRRAGDSLKVVEPSHLFQRAVGNELGCEILADSRVVTAPAMLDQGHRCLAFFDYLCRSPFGPSSRISSIHDEFAHSLWVADCVFDCNSSTLRNSKQWELFNASGVYD